MTPKEHAQQLFDEMWHQISHHNLDMVDVDFMAKQCALITVDEVIKLVNKVRSPNRFFYHWEKVKQEIENL